jgi:hypothetical protein
VLPNKIKIMKKIYTLLLLASVLLTACKKDDEKNATGTLTAKIDIKDAATNKWSGNQDFTATKVTTAKSGDDYTIVASDATGTTFTLYCKGITKAGEYKTGITGKLVKSGTTYDGPFGSANITELTNKTLKATFIFESMNMSVNNGKVDAKF